MNRLFLSIGMLGTTIAIVNPITFQHKMELSKEKWSRRDLVQVLKWFDFDETSKLSYSKIDNHVSPEWKLLTNEVANGLGQTELPSLKYGSIIKYKLQSTRMHNEKVKYNIHFKAIGLINETISDEITFTSRDVYFWTENDEFIVSSIKNMLRNTSEIKY